MTETRVQTVDHVTGEIVEHDPHAFHDVPMLDVYAGGVAEEAPRIDALATISAGTKEPSQRGGAPTPRASRDGTIYLHDERGRAPGLAAALSATGGKQLVVAFPFNNPAVFIQQRFVRYSASKLEVYGDDAALFEVKEGIHEQHEAGSDEYARLLKTCKNSVSVYFTLAEWTADGPRVLFPDGLGFYRLRFTSRHSLRNLRAALMEVAGFTRGRVAGVPFNIALDYREVADPTGAKRTIPCWTFLMKPPQTLTSRTFAFQVGRALQEGAALMLPPPAAESLETAALDAPEPDLDEPTPEAVARMEQGGRADARFWESKWFVTVRGTALASDEARAAFVRDYTHGATDSLADFLGYATEEQANALQTALERRIAGGPDAVERVAERRANPTDDQEEGFYRELDERAEQTGDAEPRFFTSDAESASGASGAPPSTGSVSAASSEGAAVTSEHDPLWLGWQKLCAAGVAYGSPVELMPELTLPCSQEAIKSLGEHLKEDVTTRKARADLLTKAHEIGMTDQQVTGLIEHHYGADWNLTTCTRQQAEHLFTLLDTGEIPQQTALTA